MLGHAISDGATVLRGGRQRCVIATLVVGFIAIWLSLPVSPAQASGTSSYPSGCTTIARSESGTGWDSLCWLGLNYNTHSDAVQAWQVGLKGEGHYSLATDSLFGSQTASVTCSFQNVFVSQTGGCDGVVGPKSWHTMRSTLALNFTVPYVGTNLVAGVTDYYSQNYLANDFVHIYQISPPNHEWSYSCTDGVSWLLTTAAYPPTTLSCR